MQGGSELILTWLCVYIAGIAVWFFIAGWNDLHEEAPGRWIVTVGLMWPAALFIFVFMLLGVVVRDLIEKKQ